MHCISDFSFFKTNVSIRLHDKDSKYCAALALADKF